MKCIPRRHSDHPLVHQLSQNQWDLEMPHPDCLVNEAQEPQEQLERKHWPQWHRQE